MWLASLVTSERACGLTGEAAMPYRHTARFMPVIAYMYAYGARHARFDPRHERANAADKGQYQRGFIHG